MKLEIEIDEGYIAELVSKEIARRIVETQLLEKAIATDVKEVNHELF
mgnify:CR=1 FL=1